MGGGWAGLVCIQAHPSSLAFMESHGITRVEQQPSFLFLPRRADCFKGASLPFFAQGLGPMLVLSYNKKQSHPGGGI